MPSNTYLIKVDRLSPADRQALLLAPEATEITESSSRRWSVQPGDTLLFGEGKGLELTFFATADVSEVATHLVEAEPPSQFRTTVRITKFQRFPERSLDEFMYSLVQVANFKRPYLHFKHHLRVPEHDVVTLREGYISESRSIYFGLLTHLPQEWRDYVQAAAGLHAATQDLGLPPIADEASHSVPTERLIKSLLDVLHDSVFSPSQFAASIQDLRAQTPLAQMPIEAIDETGNTWSVERLLRLAETQRNSVNELWSRINSRARQGFEPAADRRARWRPHHW